MAKSNRHLGLKGFFWNLPAPWMGLQSLAGVNSAQEGRRYYMTAAAILLAELKRGVKNHLAYPIQAASEAIIVILIAIAVPSLVRGMTPWGVAGVIVEEPEKVVALVAVFVALVGLQTSTEW